MKNCRWTSRVVYFMAVVELCVLRKILVQTSSVFSSLILILVNRRFCNVNTFKNRSVGSQEKNYRFPDATPFSSLK